MPIVNLKYSILDRISKAISPVIRNLSDINSVTMGTSAIVIRVYKQVEPQFQQMNKLQTKSVLGDFEEKIQSEIISNIQIHYPFNKIEYFQTREGNYKTSVFSYGIDLLEILPIEADLRFSGDFEKDPIELQQFDKIIDVFFDEKQNPIFLILEVSKFLADFIGKNIVSKKVQLTLFRGQLDFDIKKIIDKYVSELKKILK